MKWKDRLLSSSLPLEYEVGKILTEHSFAVDFDYAYKRLDSASEKEFSIDLKANGYYPFEISSSIQASIDLLIECKYRNPSVSWLFIEDINLEEFTNFSSKGVIKVVDEFSEIYSKNSFSPFPICETCLKGMEVNVQNGEVHDSGITHGINQLIYSIPSLLDQYINRSLSSHLDDVHPHIICPILVTTADLRILNSDFSIQQLGKAQSLEDISYEVPFLKVYSDVYPSFEEHCRNTFKGIPNPKQQKRLEYLMELRNINLDKNGYPDMGKMYARPDKLLLQLQNGFGNDIFRETLVCTLKNLPELLDQIKAGIELIAGGFTKIKST